MWCCQPNGNCLIPSVVNGQHVAEGHWSIHEFQIWILFLSELYRPRIVMRYMEPTTLIKPPPHPHGAWRFLTVHNLGWLSVWAVLIIHHWGSPLHTGQQRLYLRMSGSGPSQYFLTCTAKHLNTPKRKHIHKESKRKLGSDVLSKWTGKQMLLLLW